EDGRILSADPTDDGGAPLDDDALPDPLPQTFWSGTGRAGSADELLQQRFDLVLAAAVRAVVQVRLDLRDLVALELTVQIVVDPLEAAGTGTVAAGLVVQLLAHASSFDTPKPR